MYTNPACFGSAVQNSNTSAASLLRLCFLGLSLLGILHATIARGDPAFTIGSPDVITGGLVFGDSVSINVIAPSPGLIKHAKVTLNGHDVTTALQSDGNSGSMTGVVSGLTVGPNIFEVFTRNGPKDAAAQLVIARATSPLRTCDSLAAISGLFPVQPSAGIGGTMITSAVLVPATTGTNALPEYCRVQGILQDRVGVAGVLGTVSYRPDQPYATRFEVRLPTAWNGRYMFQGGGGTEGGTPNATGSSTNGTNGVSMLRNGYVIAAQNGGHTNTQLPPTLPATATTPSILSQNMFFSDPLAVRDWGYNSIDVTTQTTKFLIDTYYGRQPDKSVLRRLLHQRAAGDGNDAALPGSLRWRRRGRPFFRATGHFAQRNVVP